MCDVFVHKRQERQKLSRDYMEITGKFYEPPLPEFWPEPTKKMHKRRIFRELAKDGLGWHTLIRAEFAEKLSDILQRSSSLGFDLQLGELS